MCLISQYDRIVSIKFVSRCRIGKGTVSEFLCIALCRDFLVHFSIALGSFCTTECTDIDGFVFNVCCVLYEVGPRRHESLSAPARQVHFSIQPNAIAIASLSVDA